jgi:hypothetical protein
MENKINIAELLKDCPKGMELDCSMYENVKFDFVQDGHAFPIKINTPEGIIPLSKYGCYSLNPQCKCVIFPKGKTTWEGFVPPCKFKDGDILTSFRDNICIYKGPMYDNKNLQDYYCGYRIADCTFVLKQHKDNFFGDTKDFRLATEEERQKLFQIIKDNGYKWNAETKTLEKLIVPRFKVGNTIQDEDDYKVEITKVDIDEECYEYISTIARGIGSIPFGYQDKWELVPNKFDITTLKPFDKVLARDTDNSMWTAALFSHLRGMTFYTVGGWYNQCIPFEGNQHLLGTTDDCDEFYKTWE